MEQPVTCEGWESIQKSLSLPGSPDADAAFEKAAANQAYTYETAAFLGSSETASGTEYACLCRKTPMTPDGRAAYVLVTVLLDPDGIAQVTEEKSLLNPAQEEDGWSYNQGDSDLDGVFNADVKSTFWKAVGGNVGGTCFEPVAYVAHHNGEGTDYMIFCAVTEAAPGARRRFGLVNVHLGRNGRTELEEVKDISAVPDAV